jgi:hypothetical protein
MEIETCPDCGGVTACDPPRYDLTHWCGCDPTEAERTGGEE